MDMGQYFKGEDKCMLVIKPQLQHKGGEDVSSFVTTWPGTLTYFKMENRMPGMNTTWAPQGPWWGYIWKGWHSKHTSMIMMILSLLKSGKTDMMFSFIYAFFHSVMEIWKTQWTCDRKLYLMKMSYICHYSVNKFQTVFLWLWKCCFSN